MGLVSCLGKTILFNVILVLLVLYLPNIPPDAEFTQSVKLPKPRALEGTLALNEKLQNAEILHKGKFVGPETFADFNGELYTGVDGGSIVKLVGDKVVPVAKTGKTCKGYHEEQICGRPLGMEFNKNGDLIVADAYYGILKVNVKTGTKEVLVSPDTKINGKKPRLFNSVSVASNGDIYWSDSSTKFPLYDLVFDVLSHPSGRLVQYDAKTKTNKVLIDNLHFANGVVLSENEDFVLVAESVRARVHRYYLKGPKKGTQEIFIDALPGIPDNLEKDGRGGFLVSLIENDDEENPAPLFLLSRFPLARKFVCRVFGIAQLAFETLDRYYPNELAQKAVHFIGHYSSMAGKLPSKRATVLRLSNSGEIVEALHTTNKNVYLMSEAYPFKDHLYLGSPGNDFIARVPLDSMGWTKPKTVAEPKVETKQVPKQEEAPKVKTTSPPPVKQETTTTTTTAKPPTKQTEAPKVKTTPPPPVKQQTTTPPPKPTTTTKPSTAQPTQAPKVKPTQAPKPQTTTPKPQTTQPPKAQPTKAPTQQTTQVPKAQPTQAPKKDSKPQPKKETVAPQQQTTPPSQKTTPPTKQQAPPPKQQTPPVETKKSEGSKAVPLKEPKVKN
ncbi:unnamed protein product [Diabrotica balteata]|uniref:Strictosidine synthase conserved region domain-containing protein n=1 Tax=Diabrotica balteata TaxID=107213 RepID=A0A9N9T3V3_DIABA|nr:unnamed protein product [Diabrotica balteata]